MKKYKLAWWLDKVIPLLTKIKQTRSGIVDKKFWSNIYKPKTIYGLSVVNGWIINFFPYIHRGSKYDFYGETTHYRSYKQYIKNKFLFSKPSSRHDGFRFENFHSGLSKADFILYNNKKCCYTKKLNMQLIAGFVGITQDKKTKALIPQIGWAVKVK